jgi:hypothetical protein
MIPSLLHEVALCDLIMAINYNGHHFAPTTTIHTKCKKAEPPVSLKKRKGGTSDKTLLDYQEDAAIAEAIAAVEAASKAVIIVYARRRRHYPYSAPHEAFCPTPLRWIDRGRPPEQANTLDVEETVHRHNKAQEDGNAFWLSDKGVGLETTINQLCLRGCFCLTTTTTLTRRAKWAARQQQPLRGGG